MNQSVLSARNISVRRMGVDILHGVSVDLHEGEVLAIVGPNGAGKTTFMKSILGLIPHTGTVQWRAGAKIGYVPQKVTPSRSFPLTVQEFFSLQRNGFFGAADYTDTEKELFKILDVEGLLSKRLSELSGGELQRALIAQALIGNASILCLDEPSAGIDVGGGETVYSLLRHLSQEQKKTIILISHDLDVVFKYADEVLCIDKRMICNGKPRVVLTPDAIERMYGSDTALYAHADHHEYV